MKLFPGHGLRLTASGPPAATLPGQPNGEAQRWCSDASTLDASWSFRLKWSTAPGNCRSRSKGGPWQKHEVAWNDLVSEGCLRVALCTYKLRKDFWWSVALKLVAAFKRVIDSSSFASHSWDVCDPCLVCFVWLASNHSKSADCHTVSHLRRAMVHFTTTVVGLFKDCQFYIEIFWALQRCLIQKSPKSISRLSHLHKNTRVLQILALRSHSFDSDLVRR